MSFSQHEARLASDAAQAHPRARGPLDRWSPRDRGDVADPVGVLLGAPCLMSAVTGLGSWMHAGFPRDWVAMVVLALLAAGVLATPASIPADSPRARWLTRHRDQRVLVWGLTVVGSIALTLALHLGLMTIGLA